MQFKTLALLFTSAMAVVAAPSALLSTRQSGYTCGQAMAACPNGDLYWAASTNSYGHLTHEQLSGWGNEPLAHHAKGHVWCCENNPLLAVEVNLSPLLFVEVIVYLNLEVQLEVDATVDLLGLGVHVELDLIASIGSTCRGTEIIII